LKETVIGALKVPGKDAKLKKEASVSFSEDVDHLLPEEMTWEPPLYFPKGMLTPLPGEENEKEIELIKQIPFEYFKIRVKHYEKYVPSSHDEVLVNR